MDHFGAHYNKTFFPRNPYFSGGIISFDGKFNGGSFSASGNQGSLKLQTKDAEIELKVDENTESFIYSGKTFNLLLKSDKTFYLAKLIDDKTLDVSSSGFSISKNLFYEQDDKEWLELISVGINDRKPEVNWSIDANFGLISFNYHKGNGKMFAAFLKPTFKVYSGITFNKGPSFPSFTGCNYTLYPRPLNPTALQLDFCIHDEVNESISMSIQNFYSKHLNSYFSLYYDLVSNSRTFIADFVPDKPVSCRLFVADDTTTCTVSAQVTPKFEFSMSQNLTYIGKPNFSFKYGLDSFPGRKSLNELFSSFFTK